MKKVIPILLLLAATLSGKAQNNPLFFSYIKDNPAAACLNTCPYELSPVYGNFRESPAPKGYKPVYISHYGRHGSRSSWDQAYYDDIVKILTAAKASGILTASGDSLLYETGKVIEGTAKMDGRLTPRGCREHRGIAERMYRRYPRVFRKGSRNVRVLSSEVPRCLVSMASFTGRLSELDNRLRISMDCGSEIQKVVDNGSTEEGRALRKAVRDSLRAAMSVDLEPMMTRLFTDRKAAAAIVPDPVQLCREIYYTGRISRSFDYDFNVFRFIPPEAVYAWAEIHNVEMYVSQCNSAVCGEGRMKNTEPLAANIVRCADEVLASGEIAADLRFGHDYPLLALCSYFGLSGVGERYTVKEALENWIATLYTPFAGNLQLIFYKSGKKDAPVLVKFLLNESEITIASLTATQGVYYDWEDVKGYLRKERNCQI
ncbi:MAG: histidine-type phosphatase [Bacteroidales bacterium]|nr:histidine-type phosphatase [Bacteroidales bacterium]